MMKTPAWGGGGLGVFFLFFWFFYPVLTYVYVCVCVCRKESYYPINTILHPSKHSTLIRLRKRRMSLMRNSRATLPYRKWWGGGGHLYISSSTLFAHLFVYFMRFEKNKTTTKNSLVAWHLPWQVRTVFGRSINKVYQLSDWEARPLSEGQTVYAGMVTKHLTIILSSINIQIWGYNSFFVYCVGHHSNS